MTDECWQCGAPAVAAVLYPRRHYCARHLPLRDRLLHADIPWLQRMATAHESARRHLRTDFPFLEDP